jgi:hypothetical protein
MRRKNEELSYRDRIKNASKARLKMIVRNFAPEILAENADVIGIPLFDGENPYDYKSRIIKEMWGYQ